MESIEGIEYTNESDKNDGASNGLLKLRENIMISKIFIELHIRVDRQEHIIKLDAICIEDQKVVNTKHLISDEWSKDPPSNPEHLNLVV